MKRRSRSRRIGLRWRITIAFLSGALAVSALVAGTTYLLAQRYLLDQRIEASKRQTIGNIRFATQYLSQPPDGGVPLTRLFSLLEARGSFDTLLVAEERHFSTSFAITPDSVPPALGGPVDEGRVGYAFLGEPRAVVFGSPIPGHDLAAFFFYPLADLDQTLLVLRNVLLSVSGMAVLLAAAVGTRVSRRVVIPVRRASDAARRVAEGLLETRLPVGTRDELGRLADSFNEMAAALEERIAHEQRFVGDVSHELRTPLTTLRTSTEYLLDHIEDLPPSVGRATELLAADLEYLQRLVDDLLEISRVESGKARMSWERVNVADLAREVIARRTRVGGELVRVLVNTGPERLATVADKQRLERVVGNLVDNAIVHGGGTDVSVRIWRDNGSIMLAVEDRGPGVPADLMPRIFERFYKADPSRRRDDGRGSGLGLAIARENALLHGGDIEVDSNGGQGTRFTVRLPLHEREPSS